MPKFPPLFTLSLSATLLMVGVGMIVALLPQRIFNATGSLESVGLTASAFALTYLLAQVPVGILSDRFGPRRFLILGYLLCGLSGLAFYTGQSTISIYVGRAIQGLGEAPIWALGPALLSLTYPKTKGRAIGVYNASIHAGLMMGPLLGLLVISSGHETLPFLLFAIFCFTGGVILWVFLPPNTQTMPQRRSSSTPHQFIRVLSKKRPIILLTGILLYGATYGVFTSILPVSLMISNNFSTSTISIFFVLFYASISISQLVAGPLSDRFSRVRLLSAGMLTAALGVAGFLITPGQWACVPLSLASLGLGVFCVTSIVDLNDAVPDELKGTISGGYYLFWGLGYVLGPLVIGALAVQAPWIGYSCLAVTMAAHAALVWFNLD